MEASQQIAPNQTQGAGTENNVTEVEGETITEPVTAEPEENTTPTESTEGSSEEATTTTPPSETSTEKPATSESNEKKTITVFYTDEEELELHKASAEISYASDDAKYKAAFESLQQSKDAKLVPLWSKEIELKSVQFKDGGSYAGYSYARYGTSWSRWRILCAGCSKTNVLPV